MATFTVTTLVDENDIGATATAPGGTGLSLREALALTNANADADTIVFDENLTGGGTPNVDDGVITLGGAELGLSNDVTIDGDVDGDGDADITVSGNDASRVFLITGAGVEAAVNGLTIRDGNGMGAGGAGGGGISVSASASLTLSNATVSDNTSDSGGGGISNLGTITLIDVTVSGNTTSSLQGGGISNAGTATLTNTTLSGNAAAGSGGGIQNVGTARLTNVTVSGNSAGGNGGGIDDGGVIFTLANSIVTGNASGGSGDDLSAPFLFIKLGGNIIGDTFFSSGVPTGIGGYSLDEIFRDVVTVDPDGAGGLAPFQAGLLADNGGPVRTIALNPDIAVNPALDTGETPFLDETDAAVPDLNGDGDQADIISTDARGFDRTVDAGLSSHELDLGAFEQQLGQTFTVTTLDDELDLSDTDPATFDPTDLSLREALALTNADPTSADTIDFDPLFVNGLIDLTLGELVISGDVTIEGDRQITVNGGGYSRVFRVEGAGTVTANLNGLGIFQGEASDGGGLWVGDDEAVTLTNSALLGNTATIGDGGGIYARLASVTLIDSFVSGNSASGFGGAIQSNASQITAINTTFAQNGAGYGGVLWHGGAGGATIVGSTLWGNYAAYDGGAIVSNNGTFVLTNTTLWGNSADRDGGGIANHFANVTLTNVTITGNYAGDEGGGILNGPGGTLTLANSIVAGNENSAGVSDVEGPVTLLGGNILGDTFTPASGPAQGGIDLTDIFATVDNNLFTGVLSGEANGNGGDVLTVALNRDPANLALNSGDANRLDDTQVSLDLNGNNTADTVTTDARGFARDVGGVDLGALELQNDATYTVTTLEDQEYDGGDLAAELADGGGLSLREALALTNADPLSADTIIFDPGLAGGTLTLLHGELVVVADTSITGDDPGGVSLDITIDAATASRVFMIDNGKVTLNSLTMTGGDATCGCDPGYGGAISVGAYFYAGYADVTISNSTVSNSFAIYGGGISVDTGSSLSLINTTVTGNNAGIGGGIAVNDGATLTTLNTTISDNHAAGLYGYGGGIAVNGGGTASLTSTTIYGNTAVVGGGIYNSGHLTLTNATLADNSAIDAGGGIYSTPCGCSITDIINSTITGNATEGDGGGIAHLAGVLNLTNSIVAGNGAGGTGPDIDAAGAVNYHGRNIFSQAGLGASGDIVVSDVADVFASVTTLDPSPADGDEVQAGVLANNGGPVHTVALTRDASNPALDAADGSAPTTDARGAARYDVPPVPNSSGTAADMGAYELQNQAPSTTADSYQVDEDNVLSVTTLSGVLHNDIDGDSDPFSAVLVDAPLHGQLTLNADGSFTYTPDPDYFGPDSFTYTANDGFDDSAITSVDLTVNAVNDAPLLVNVAPAAAYGIGTTGTLLSPALGVFDVDSPNLASATVRIASGFLPTDQLFVNLTTDGSSHFVTADAETTNISVQSNASGTLVLVGQDTLAHWQSVLAAVSYTSAAVDPTLGGSNTNRTITWVVNDGALNSQTPNTDPNFLLNTTILHFASLPAVDLDASAAGTGFDTTYTENGAPIRIVDTDVTISDSDSAALASATIVLTNANAGDSLSLAGALPGGIASSIDTSVAGRITLTLIGIATLAEYQTALGEIRFSNSSENPASSDRDISVVLSDGEVDSNTAHATIHVVPVNDAPTITSNGGGDTANVSVLERTTAVTTVVATDPDSPTLTYSIIGGSDAGKFQINGASGALSFISGPNFDVPADADHNNSYVVQVRASDGTLTDDQLITVQVTDDPNVTSTVHWIKSVDVGPHPAGWLPAGNGDFNGDGTDDLAWFNAATGNLDIWKLSNGAWAGSSNVGSHPAGYQPVGFGDYNGDGVDDVLWFNPTTRDVDLWKIVDGQWAGSVIIGAHPAGSTPSLSGDFNGDGTSDVLWYNPTTNAVDIWKINGGQWAGSVDVGTHPAGYTPALAGDFNGDGTDDVLWYNPTTGAVDVWKLSNGQWAGSVAVGSHPLGWQPLGAADFNLDGTTDVAWHNPTTNNIDVWLLENGQWSASYNIGSHPGGTTLTPTIEGRGAIVPPSFQPVVAVGAGDFDHNGVADIMWYDTGTRRIDNWMLEYS